MFVMVHQRKCLGTLQGSAKKAELFADLTCVQGAFYSEATEAQALRDSTSAACVGPRWRAYLRR